MKKFWYDLQELEKLVEKERTESVKILTPELIRKKRFFVRPNETARVLFLDDINFVIWEHRFSKGTDRYNYETCIKDIEGECPLCDIGNRRYLAVVSTILSYWKDSEGKTRLTKKLLVAKGEAKDRLIRRQSALNGLKGKIFTFYRSNQRTSNALGTDIDFEKEFNEWDKLKEYCPEGVEFEEWLKPFDYPEIFKPKTIAELKEIIGVKTGVGEGEGEKIEEDIEKLL